MWWEGCRRKSVQGTRENGEGRHKTVQGRGSKRRKMRQGQRGPSTTTDHGRISETHRLWFENLIDTNVMFSQLDEAIERKRLKGRGSIVFVLSAEERENVRRRRVRTQARARMEGGQHDRAAAKRRSRDVKPPGMPADGRKACIDGRSSDKRKVYTARKACIYGAGNGVGSTGTTIGEERKSMWRLARVCIGQPVSTPHHHRRIDWRADWQRRARKSVSSPGQLRRARTTDDQGQAGGRSPGPAAGGKGP